MGTIIERKTKTGRTSYLAQITIKPRGQEVHRENKTFKSKREAAGWIAIRELEIMQWGPGRLDDPKLADVIQRYMADAKLTVGRSKAQVLRVLSTMPIASMRCSQITSAHVVDLARQLFNGQRQPQTVQNYLAHLSAIFAIAKPAWGCDLDPTAMRDAQLVAKRLGLTAKTRRRNRRPTLEELERLIAFFNAKRTHALPMPDLILFALFSTRRQEEITRIMWADLDRVHSRVLVRDMKHPGEKIGNDQWVDLVPEAMAVIARQPQLHERIFPYNSTTISAAFTRACKMLEIDDLHFHDLRHEGVTRLFEIGWSIPQVACVSGHRSWQSLQRYTHIRQRGDKYEQWRLTPKKSPTQWPG